MQTRVGPQLPGLEQFPPRYPPLCQPLLGASSLVPCLHLTPSHPLTSRLTPSHPQSHSVVQSLSLPLSPSTSVCRPSSGPQDRAVPCSPPLSRIPTDNPSILLLKRPHSETHRASPTWRPSHLVTCLLERLDRARGEPIRHNDLHLLDLARLDLVVCIRDPFTEGLDVGRLDSRPAPDTKAGGGITVRSDVIGNRVALEEGRQRLDLALVEVGDDEAHLRGSRLWMGRSGVKRPGAIRHPWDSRRKMRDAR